jgi:hypothetical protein
VALYSPKNLLVFISVWGWVNLRATVQLEGWSKLKKSTDIRNQKRDHLAYITVPQPTMLPRAPALWYLAIIKHVFWSRGIQSTTWICKTGVVYWPRLRDVAYSGVNAFILYYAVTSVAKHTSRTWQTRVPAAVIIVCPKVTQDCKWAFLWGGDVFRISNRHYASFNVHILQKTISFSFFCRIYTVLYSCDIKDH